MRPVRDQSVDRRLRSLIRSAQAGDSRAEDEICRTVENGVRTIAHRFFYPGAEYEDVVQYGMIGVVTGIRSYDPAADRGPEVYSWLLFCAQRWIVTGLKKSVCEKHKVLSEACSFEQPVNDTPNDAPYTLHDVLPDGTDLVERLAEREQIQALVKAFRRLTPLERRAMLTVIDGKSYAGDKVIDNASARARRKLREAA